MILVSANPFHGLRATTATKARKGRKKKGASAMAKKRRSAAQRAATARMLAANRSRRRKPTSSNPVHYKAKSRRRRRVSHNPVSHRRHYRRVRRNPSPFSGGILGELISKEGLLMVAGAFAAPMATNWLQAKIMPSADGWTKVAIKAGLVVAGAYAIDRFLKMRKVALAYGVTGGAVVAAEAVQVAGLMGLADDNTAYMLANIPGGAQRIAAGLGDYRVGLASDTGIGADYNYRHGLAAPFKPLFG